MAFTFDSTVGSATANSYVSVEEADDYFVGRLATEAWDALSSADKQKALVMATGRIDREPFGGKLSNELTQRLQWPRKSVASRSKVVGDVPDTIIPLELKQATFEQALHYIKQAADDTTTVSDYDLETLTSFKVGPIDVAIKDGIKADRLPTIVKQFLEAIGPNALLTSQGLRFYA